LGQEFIIKSQKLEDKVNQLFPSQGGFQAGVDLSASTTVVPIVDLTETAEGSNVRIDIQKSLSFNTASPFSINNTTTDLVTTTGYFRVFGTVAILINSGAVQAQFIINDGTTDKVVWGVQSDGTTGTLSYAYDFLVFLEAGHTLKGKSTTFDCNLVGSTRQIADIAGNLTNP
tara:strand:+ start:326 stop:841 length:516 start_codon:yes stop_codon:yes gene_type:complete